MQNLVPAEYIDSATGLHISAVCIFHKCHAAVVLEDRSTGQISLQPCANLSQALTISETAEKLINQ